MKRAVFFDRDGTIIHAVHYLADPDQVCLIDGVAETLNELDREGYLRIVITNQAAIKKGFLDERELGRIHARIDDLLALQGASIDAYYHCPETRASDDHETVDHPDRKPGPGMLLRAADDFDLSLDECWMVGDVLSDAVAGYNAGCRGSILIESGLYRPEFGTHPAVDRVARSIREVPGIILRRREN